MHYYLYPLLQKEHQYVTLHVGTNDSINYTFDEIYKVLLLKCYIEKITLGVKVAVSQPVAWYDSNPLVDLTVHH